jgi:oligosaccharide repeat unit polymerase
VFWSWYIVTKSLFSPYILFFISALLFNGGQIILEVFNLNEKGILEEEFSSTTILATMFIVVIGLAVFHLGALMSAFQISVAPTQVSPQQKVAINRRKDKEISQVGWLFFSISFLPSLLILQKSISIVLSGGYFALYQQNDATSFDAAPAVLAAFLVPSAMFILAGSGKNVKEQYLSCILILLYATINFFLGKRNVAAMPLLCFAWLWHQLIRPISKVFLGSVGAFILLIVFPLVGASRNSGGEDRLSVDALLNTFTSINNPLVAVLSEMGGSMNTIAYTIELVPRFREFQWGAEYLYALFTLVPNLFWKLHPTVARGLPGLWLTWAVRPDFAARGGGLGYSFIAEAYLNFGWFGAPIALGVIGFLFAKFTLWAAKSKEPARMAAVASFTSFFLFFARAESGVMVRSLVWYSWLPYLSVCLLGWLRSKKLAR